jgi:hypothetical protein
MSGKILAGSRNFLKKKPHSQGEKHRQIWSAAYTVLREEGYSTSVAAHAMLKRTSQNDDATNVFHVCLRAGSCNLRNFSTTLARPKTPLRKATTTIEGPLAPEADITMGMKILLFPAFPASFCSLWTTLWSRARSCALNPSSPARAPLPSEVSDPIVTIETSKLTLALEERGIEEDSIRI